MTTSINKKNEQDDNNIIDLQNLLKYDDHVVFTYINQWEKHSIGKIQLAAEQARNDLIEIFQTKNLRLINLINQLNDDIKKNQHIEINLNKLYEQFITLRQDLTNFFSYVHLEHDHNQLPIHLIKLNYKNNDSTTQIDNNTDDNIINIPGTTILTSSILNNATPYDQQQMLGERLFVLVQQIEPKLTAKITGMFLELDKKYILLLIKSNKLLKKKVKEAIEIFQAYQYRQRNVIKL